MAAEAGRQPLRQPENFLSDAQRHFHSGHHPNCHQRFRQSAANAADSTDAGSQLTHSTKTPSAKIATDQSENISANYLPLKSGKPSPPYRRTPATTRLSSPPLHRPSIYFALRRVRHSPVINGVGSPLGFPSLKGTTPLGTCARRTVPRAVLGHKRSAAIIKRKLVSRIKCKLQRRPVRAQQHVRNDGVRGQLRPLRLHPRVYVVPM